jgi:hypothetical protein
MTIPRYVVGTAAEATQILNRLSRIGWHPRPGFAVPGAGATNRLVLYGRVPTLSAAAAAAAAAGRGVGIVAIADPATPPGRTLLSALENLGPVHRGTDGHPEPATPATPAPVPVPAAVAGGDGEVLAALLPEQRALLGRLANGETIATAAAAEYLSLRTADRRIAQARAQLGVRTTREAVLVFVHQRRPE